MAGRRTAVKGDRTDRVGGWVLAAFLGVVFLGLAWVLKGPMP